MNMIKEGDIVVRIKEQSGGRYWTNSFGQIRYRVIKVKKEAVPMEVELEGISGLWFVKYFKLVESKPVPEVEQYKDFGYAHEYD